ncbi:hypothetical protein DT076_05125 [Desertihabitans brevis]|uniref:DICT domain-containing protein n=1 Tax=Desertihabitans brevis TaxID=2268447 RepID=A0A367YZ45_9ACTN|nr:DICT sensory domain-containing protein [Desertihabitans brevis]RCK70779.1 hypothetical protein DT076_05125 [Desertihabitans brevis]
MDDTSPADGDRTLLDRLFRRGELQVSQRALVDLATSEVAAVRILTHGPLSSDPLSSDAVEHGSPGPAEVRRLIGSAPDPATLDAAVRARALAAADADPLVPGAARVIDAELSGLSELGLSPQPAPTVLVLDARTVLDRPASMLRLVGAARAQGWQLGLRQVGADHLSLAALGVVEPALVVLSDRVLREPTSQLSVETIQATTAFVHTSGGTVAAEDVDDHPGTRAAAVAAGATLVTGRPLDRPRRVRPVGGDRLFRRFTPPLPTPHRSPFELASRRAAPRRAGKELLLAVSRRLEATATTAGRSSMVLAAFQQARHLTPGTLERYERLGRRCSLVLAAAQDVARTTVPGVSVADLDASDPLVQEWDILVLSPTGAAMLAARDTGLPAADDRSRQFDYVLSHDRDLVAHAARSMLTRLTQRSDAPDPDPVPVGAEALAGPGPS